ncbi:hypothetical protein [Blastomonas aquatica]|uniref:TPR repeat-containing protein n=1 Tax=Blastomonas aquatica TaxID=1510276 RepID=A0ABQ1JK90_9SPHN|nr:hypothetical protein [Blastomonas aquatica]GGB68406.1 hypothetical protein GCM10010833_24530 [Blastomonas aquatica]
MMKSAISVLFASTALAFAAAPAVAQDAAEPSTAQPTTDQPSAGQPDSGQSGTAQPGTAQPGTAQPAAAAATQAPAGPLSPEQVEAQNKAIADFSAAQQAQAAGNHAQVISTLEPALPVIREIAGRNPSDIQNAGFLASALTITANSQGALGNIDAIAPLYMEAAPQWTKVYEADKANAGVRGTLISILVNLGNFSLNKQDKMAAQPLFEQALAVTKEGRAADPASADLANFEFASLIGLNQATGEASYLEAAKPIGAELREKGTVSAANQPAVDAILGAA